jgi:glycosyltransferase involved in cell wall biosynthesis
VANSEFTRRWVDRYWGCDSEVVYPPVTMHAPAAKEPIILSVGRFFPADMGHSKKQLELVCAFRTLVDQGVRGWTLHLVGGCSEAGRSYLDLVRRAADGYPVQIHVDATGPELETLYAAASIYWHASGLGEDPERHPGRLEHFGITTVEAMSAGVVPVVIGLAGQLETVRHGVDGLHFQTLRGLTALTRQLIDDEGTRERMATSGLVRARGFDIDAFEVHLRAIVDRLLADP